MAETEPRGSHRPAITASDVEVVRGTTYPAPLDANSSTRLKRRLGDAFGLTQFGVNHVILPPGCESSLRHWHATEDEFVYVLKGSPTLVTSAGEQVLQPGKCAGFQGGCPDGHHLVNRTDEDVEIVEVGTRLNADPCYYPDDDLLWVEEPGVRAPLHKSGERY